MIISLSNGTFFFSNICAKPCTSKSLWFFSLEELGFFLVFHYVTNFLYIGSSLWAGAAPELSKLLYKLSLKYLYTGNTSSGILADLSFIQVLLTQVWFLINSLYDMQESSSYPLLNPSNTV